MTTAPRTGRPLPSDSLANDHWYWQINLRTRDLGAAAYAETRAAELSGISPRAASVKF